VTYRFGERSERCLIGVHPDLIAVTRKALVFAAENDGPDFGVIAGLRSPEEQIALVAKGASGTVNSAHLRQVSGVGHAVDLLPVRLPGWESAYPQKSDPPSVVRQKLARFEDVARCMFLAADLLEFPLQWGNDWDVDGIPTGRDPNEKGWLQDMPHFQVPPPHRMSAASERRLERRAARARGEKVIS
jgi:peptidoglycan L-alanyl-D-glutamate endopeptidase CwlK